MLGPPLPSFSFLKRNVTEFLRIARWVSTDMSFRAYVSAPNVEVESDSSCNTIETDTGLFHCMLLSWWWRLGAA